jgi:hypothetical protein
MRMMLLVVLCGCGCGAILYDNEDVDADSYDAPQPDVSLDDTDVGAEWESLPGDGLGADAVDFEPNDDAGCDADCTSVCRDNGYTSGECRGHTCSCWNDTTDDGGGGEESPDTSEDTESHDTSDTVDSGTTCRGPHEGTGRTSSPGSCIETYLVGVYAGETYTISTCGSSSMDPLLAVYGACNCVLYEDCGGVVGAGNYCSCTATSTGLMTICASAAQADETVRWSYTVEGPCYDP